LINEKPAVATQPAFLIPVSGKDWKVHPGQERRDHTPL